MGGDGRHDAGTSDPLPQIVRRAGVTGDVGIAGVPASRRSAADERLSRPMGELGGGSGISGALDALGSLGIKTGGAMELASHTASLLHS